MDMTLALSTHISVCPCVCVSVSSQMLAPGDVVMRVLYDFSAEGRGELSLYEGQVRGWKGGDGRG